ncbi:hypothetical protein ACFOKI_07430 [Sphingomonas qilianensis]|uniref:Uncharacterized protein n=1 Tax=Sphingomonas qilianensis TaxID=1736690 RepID=A0ABU9XSJ2_9SPHN
MKIEADLPENVAEFVFDTRDAIPLAELADSFKALDRLFVRESKSGAHLAIAEIRKGSIVALLAPFVPFMGQAVEFATRSTEVAEFVKRLRDGLNAFAGIGDGAVTVPLQSDDRDVAADIAALVKPLAGRQGSRLDVAHIKYRSRSKERTVELEVSYGSTEIDRIAVNAGRATEQLVAIPETSLDETQPRLLRKVVLSLQQTNTGPAKASGKTADRGIIRSVTEKPLAVYFAKTIEDLKKKMVGRSSNPFRQPFKVDVLVEYEAGEPKSYTVIDVHGAYRQRKKKDATDLLASVGSGPAS